MICQSCGLEAATAPVSFQYNIGLLIVRFSKTIAGKFCKNCINKTFWECTAINLVLGWWGIISFFLTPFLLIHNIVQFAQTRSLPAVPKDARAPVLDDEAYRRLTLYEHIIRARLANGEDFAQLAQDIGARVGVTPGQVQLYVSILGYGFPNGNRPSQPLTIAQVILDAEGKPRCSFCGGYVRLEAVECKHCHVSFVLLSEVKVGASYPQGNRPHAAVDSSGVWRCSECQGAVRRDASLCKHCKIRFA